MQRKERLWIFWCSDANTLARCKLPSNKAHLLLTKQNCGWKKFTVHIRENLKQIQEEHDKCLRQLCVYEVTDFESFFRCEMLHYIIQNCVFLQFPNRLMSVKGAATRAPSGSWSFLSRKCRSAGWYLGCLVNASFTVAFRAITWGIWYWANWISSIAAASSRFSQSKDLSW